MGGRFGKYGDLKRKERLKTKRPSDKCVLKKDPKESRKKKPKRKKYRINMFINNLYNQIQKG